MTDYSMADQIRDDCNAAERDDAATDEWLESVWDLWPDDRVVRVARHYGPETWREATRFVSGGSCDPEHFEGLCAAYEAGLKAGRNRR